MMGIVRDILISLWIIGAVFAVCRLEKRISKIEAARAADGAIVTATDITGTIPAPRVNEDEKGRHKRETTRIMEVPDCEESHELLHTRAMPVKKSLPSIIWGAYHPEGEEEEAGPMPPTYYLCIVCSTEVDKKGHTLYDCYQVKAGKK